jgi:adenylate kinase
MIIFMGVAGAGKSVQGRMLADQLALPWLSTGEFLRMLVAGERRKEMLAGKLLSDQEMIALIQKVLTLVPTNEEFILDGFPRTVDQAEWLMAQVKAGLLDVTAVFQIEASQEVVKARLLERGRQDDHHEAIAERFREYEQTIVPIVEKMKTSGVQIYTIDGEKPVREVHENILHVLGY